MKLVNKILALIVFLTLSVVSSMSNADVYVTSQPGYPPWSYYTEMAWSTNLYCRYDVYNICHLQNPQIGVKYSVGEDRDRWIVLPPTLMLPQAVNNDISWAISYLNNNWIPWRWGTCLQNRTVYNVTDCLW